MNLHEIHTGEMYVDFLQAYGQLAWTVRTGGCYGIKFLQTGEIHPNQSLRKINGYLFDTVSDRDGYVEVDTLT